MKKLFTYILVFFILSYVYKLYQEQQAAEQEEYEAQKKAQEERNKQMAELLKSL